MADQLLEQVRDLAEGQIDFEGQRLSEFFCTTFLVIVGVAAFFVGNVFQSIESTLYIGLGGTALAFVLIVPPWPYFKRHPVRWLPVPGSEAATASHGITVDGKTVG